MLRAHTTVVLAMSADGKIADRDRTAARFSSANDLKHLETQIAQADGVLSGAGTLRAYGTCLPVRDGALLVQRHKAQKPPQPVQIVCSYSGQLDPQLRFFQQSVPRWLLTSEAGGDRWRQSPAFDYVAPWLRPPTDWQDILQKLYNLGIERLAVLGGGTLVADLVERDLVDELYLTLCPLLLGGKTAPTPVDGQGLTTELAIRLQLLEVKTMGSEVFLHYCRCHPESD
ncbi:dihydrofolate reductase family protein [Oscillatoria sp. CS-180]|uniref:RibD family protein n=1 Tax=Oscillatoria sp. CS-180 TaxID=3021720 RepID=UPI00232E56BE|nr:dihydrofolate reductase family protein [Oscillatoria sp. CS-180]MDB9528943.1 dihydrofolate reductase family protein [Oscillatoria sp. CS-180]